MAVGGHRRSRRVRQGGLMARAGDADPLKPRGGIRDRVKPGAAESAVKPSIADSAEEGWIYVRGCRIEKASLRFNSQGDVYIPDSEDEDEAHEVAANGAIRVDLPPAVAADEAAGVDLTPAVAMDRATSVDLAPTVAAVGATGADMAPAVAADGVAGMEMNPEIAGRLAKKVLGEDLHPKVAARLAEVLSEIEPFCHECFINMYKVMVPLFFTPPP